MKCRLKKGRIGYRANGVTEEDRQDGQNGGGKFEEDEESEIPSHAPFIVSRDQPIVRQGEAEPRGNFDREIVTLGGSQSFLLLLLLLDLLLLLLELPLLPLLLLSMLPLLLLLELELLQVVVVHLLLLLLLKIRVWIAVIPPSTWVITSLWWWVAVWGGRPAAVLQGLRLWL